MEGREGQPPTQKEVILQIPGKAVKVSVQETTPKIHWIDKGPPTGETDNPPKRFIRRVTKK